MWASCDVFLIWSCPTCIDFEILLNMQGLKTVQTHPLFSLMHDYVDIAVVSAVLGRPVTESRNIKIFKSTRARSRHKNVMEWKYMLLLSACLHQSGARTAVRWTH